MDLTRREASVFLGWRAGGSVWGTIGVIAIGLMGVLTPFVDFVDELRVSDGILEGVSALGDCV